MWREGLASAMSTVGRVRNVVACSQNHMSNATPSAALSICKGQNSCADQVRMLATQTARQSMVHLITCVLPNWSQHDVRLTVIQAPVMMCLSGVN